MVTTALLRFEVVHWLTDNYEPVAGNPVAEIAVAAKAVKQYEVIQWVD